tara:strand:- start:1126 stop:1344 length:219 start_codon:yes stop_codon:yes gene_type:complete
MLKQTKFRLWVNNMYYDNQDELIGWSVHINDEDTTIKRYFNKYKWWLKREYKHFIKTRSPEDYWRWIHNNVQ